MLKHAVKTLASGEYSCSCGLVWDRDEGSECPASGPTGPFVGDAPADASKAEGWKLVPAEPTKFMVHIGQALRYDNNKGIEHLYRQMLAAAPSVGGHKKRLIAEAKAASETEPVAWSYREYVWVTGLGGSVWREKLETERPCAENPNIKDIVPLYAAPLQDANLYRQWFNAVQDLNPKFLEPADYAAAARLNKP